MHLRINPRHQDEFHHATHIQNDQMRLQTNIMHNYWKPIRKWEHAHKRVHDAGVAIHVWYAAVSLNLPAVVLPTKSHSTIARAAVV